MHVSYIICTSLFTVVDTAREKDDLDLLPSVSTEPPHSPTDDQPDGCVHEEDLSVDQPSEQPSERADVLPPSLRLTKLQGDAESEKLESKQEPENNDKMEIKSPRQSPPPSSGDPPPRIEGGPSHIDKESIEGREEEEEGKEGVYKEETGETSPTKLILSIPFYHIKLKRSHGRSPSETARITAFCCVCA